MENLQGNQKEGVIVMARSTKTIKFGEFMNGEYNRKAEAKKSKQRAIIKAATTGSLIVTASKVAIPAMMVTIPIVMLTRSFPAMAATTSAAAAVPVGGVISDAVKGKIIHAFDPLVDLMVGLSIPIAGVMVTGGALLVLIGQKDGGFKLIMNAALGYILVQLSPMFIDLLIGIGKAV